MKQLNDAFATWCYLGRIPWGPGTWGSIGGLIFIYMMLFHWHDVFGHNITLFQYFTFTLALFLLGVLSSGKFDKDHGTQDSKMIVIDEVVGMMVTCIPLFLMPLQSHDSMALSGWLLPICAFVFFRFFDILKPWPIKLIDAKMHGGWGVMLDDVLAGIAAAACLYVIGTYVL